MRPDPLVRSEEHPVILSPGFSLNAWEGVESRVPCMDGAPQVLKKLNYTTEMTRLRQNNRIVFAGLFNSEQRRPLMFVSLLRTAHPRCPDARKPFFQKYGLTRAPILSTLAIKLGTGAAQTLPMPDIWNWRMWL